MKRQIVTVGCVAALGLLTGCVYDAARPQVTYENRLAEDVLVTVEGANMPYEVAVGSNSSNSLGTDECKGTAIVVKTEDGTLDYTEG